MSDLLRPEAKGNPNAISTRLKGRNAANINGQRRHDLRIGPQPSYVNGDMTKLNRVLIEPWTGPQLKRESVARRDRKPRRRAMKSNAGIAMVGIITFGKKAQKRFARLNQKEQDAAYREIADAIAKKLNTTLTGLVVHRDETADHAHFQLVGYTHDGDPVSDQTKKRHTSELQDLAAEIIQKYDSKIERGRRIKERIDGGALPHETVNRQVNILHRDLPLEIADLREQLDRLYAKKKKLERYIKKLETKDSHNAAEAKRLIKYEERLNKQEASLSQREATVAELEKTLATVEKRTQKAERDAKAAEKKAQDAHEAEQYFWQSVEEAKREEAYAKERTPEFLRPNHIDDLPNPLREAIDESARNRGFIPLEHGSKEDDLHNTRHFLETYIRQIAARIYQTMTKTITDVRRQLRNALKREKDLKTKVSSLVQDNTDLRAEIKSLHDMLAATKGPDNSKEETNKPDF